MIKRILLGWIGGWIVGCGLSVLITIIFQLEAGWAAILGIGCGGICTFARILIGQSMSRIK